MVRLRDELRYEPTEKRVRATLGERTVVDSTRAVLVWEPHRVVPTYAVPVDDVRAELVPMVTGANGDAGAAAAAAVAGRALLHPGIPFSVRSTAGTAFTVRAGDETRDGAAFVPADPDLAGYVVFDFKAFDVWHEEDELVVGHPRDPFHRVDTRTSSREVRIELGGHVLAESSRPVLVFETSLPTRFYLPREDVVADARPSARTTHCPYKGEASYWSFDAGDDLAWTYWEPLPDATALAGLVAFFDELVDVVVDGVRRERPGSAEAKSIVEEARS